MHSNQMNEHQKQEKLHQYTKSALLELTQNKSTRWNQIMDEISNPSKEPAKLRIWGRVLLKSCLEFQKNPAVFMAIVNLVFKKIPWFDSQNHLNTFDIFEKLVMNIVSVNPNYMIQAFKVLIDNLVSKQILSL